MNDDTMDGTAERLAKMIREECESRPESWGPLIWVEVMIGKNVLPIQATAAFNSVENKPVQIWRSGKACNVTVPVTRSRAGYYAAAWHTIVVAQNAKFWA